MTSNCEKRRYDGIVRLHLVYYGPVKSSGNKPQTKNKRDIRTALSNQIESFCIRHLPDVQMAAGGLRVKDIDGHRFVALVTKALHLDAILVGFCSPQSRQVGAPGNEATMMEGGKRSLTA